MLQSLWEPLRLPLHTQILTLQSALHLDLVSDTSLRRVSDLKRGMGKKEIGEGKEPGVRERDFQLVSHPVPWRSCQPAIELANTLHYLTQHISVSPIWLLVVKWTSATLMITLLEGWEVNVYKRLTSGRSLDIIYIPMPWFARESPTWIQEARHKNWPEILPGGLHSSEALLQSRTTSAIFRPHVLCVLLSKIRLFQIRISLTPRFYQTVRQKKHGFLKAQVTFPNHQLWGR